MAYNLINAIYQKFHLNRKIILTSLFIFIFISWIVCCCFPAVASEADDIMIESITELAETEQIQVCGSVVSGGVKHISIKVLDSFGRTVYINQILSNIEGQFVHAFKLTYKIDGNYDLYISHSEMAAPVHRTFHVTMFDGLYSEPIQFKDGGGNILKNLINCNHITVTTRVANNGQDSKNARLFAALYSNHNGVKKLERVSIADETLEAGTLKTIETGLALPGSVQGYIVRAFVWESDMLVLSNGQLEPDPTEADIEFTETGYEYRYFAPGIIRPDEGTVEITMNMDRPVSELGTTWDIAFSLLSAKSFNPEIKNILAVYTPPLPNKGLYMVLRNGTNAYCLTIPNFTYNVGEPFNLAFTWKAGNKICLYKNGILLGSTSIGTALNENIFSYNFTIEKDGPFRPQKIKISTKALSSNQLTASPAADFIVTSDTSLIVNLETSTIISRNKTTWHAQSSYSTLMPALRPETQCFTEGEHVFYPVMSINYGKSSKEYTVNILAKDAYGNVRMDKQTLITVSNDGEYHINKIMLPELNERGFYTLSTTISSAGTVISQWDSAISVIPANETEIADGELASYYGQKYPLGYDASIIKKLGAGMTRAWVFNWSNLEPIKGNFQWETADAYIKSCKEANIEVLGVLGYYPHWAAQEPTPEERANALAIEYRFDRWKPKDLAEWENYIYQTVSRYKNDVQYWEIGNEMNYHPPYKPYSFSGTVDEYAEMLRVAYSAAKRANPNCKILICGFAAPYEGVNDTTMALKMTDAKYAKGYYDIYNVHGYSGTEAFKDCIDNLKIHHPGKEYWMTEEMPHEIYDEAKRVYSIVDRFISFLESGYSKYIHMGINVTDVFIDMETQSPTKCYQAAGVLQNHIRKCNNDIGTYSGFHNDASFSLRHYLRRTDGKYLSILGCYPKECDIYINGTIERAEDIYGNPVNIQVSNGVSKVSLKSVLYIVSSQPLNIQNTIITSQVNYITNGSFEDNEGDITTGGLEAGKPVNWIFREKDYDPLGKIMLSQDAFTGKYAISVKSSGAGRVYLFQNVTITVPGNYKVTAKYKKLSGDSNLKPFMFLFNRDKNITYHAFMFNITNTGYETFTATFNVPDKTIQDVAVGFGIYSGQGEILIDDIRMEEAN